VSGPQLAFFVPGHPETQGSKIAGRTKSGHHFVRDDNPDLEPWRDSIVLHARAAAHAARVGRDLPHAGPVDVDIWSYFARRKGHLKADGHTLRDTAPAYPIARGIGDVDKLVRAVLDSLTKARVIADDVLVVDVHG
jgi:Holliday junction resolvase RusA-like endonuclease